MSIWTDNGHKKEDWEGADQDRNWFWDINLSYTLSDIRSKKDCIYQDRFHFILDGPYSAGK